ncbi:MAG: hypothetical protein ABSH16_04540 [Sedimentisphaerales bacterium]
MKVWVISIQNPGCDSSVTSVFYTWNSAWANLLLKYRDVIVCDGAKGKCELEHDNNFPHFHGTAKEFPKEKGWVEVDPIKGKIFWYADEFEVE